MISYEDAKVIFGYLVKYRDIFNSNEINAILSYLTNSDYEVFMPDIMRELCDELKIIPDNKSLYKAFMMLVDSVFDIKNKRIIEVGGGIIPTLGKRISNYQDSGNIKVYDPRLSIYEKSTEKIVLFREKFTINTDVEDADLLIGLMPCEAANVIVKSAVNNRKDFMLALCEGGSHGDDFDGYADEEKWRATLISYAQEKIEENGLGKIKIKYLKEYGDPYPIIYNERG
ncbi:MAG: hypothetical protein IJ097_04060 [Bacilli bacterium]|nr:hypothetical protein [Bacilli bacterium]